MNNTHRLNSNNRLIEDNAEQQNKISLIKEKNEKGKQSRSITENESQEDSEVLLDQLDDKILSGQNSHLNQNKDEDSHQSFLVKFNDKVKPSEYASHTINKAPNSFYRNLSNNKTDCKDDTLIVKDISQSDYSSPESLIQKNPNPLKLKEQKNNIIEPLGKL